MTDTRATVNGTRLYAERFTGKSAEGHFRMAEVAGGLTLSSIGIGTYLGETDARTDAAYTEAVAAAVRGGVNVIDSAINYRMQRSERSIGAALQQLFADGFAREELVICSKGGYLTPDGELPANPREYFQREYFDRGICTAQDIAGGAHCMTPRYLEDQLSRSVCNLGHECVDVYYLHNAAESQLGAVSREEFQRLIKQASFVICHGGATPLEIIRAGKPAVVMPRRKRFGEIVNDHQVAFVEALAGQGWIIPAMQTDDLPKAVAEAMRLGGSMRSAVPSPMVGLVAKAVEELGGARPADRQAAA